MFGVALLCEAVPLCTQGRDHHGDHVLSKDDTFQ